MMKITKLSLCVSMAGLLATLPAAYANEIVTNCTQVSAVDGGDSNTTNNESCAKLAIPFDYGDAPDPSFNTLDASGGARHQLGTDVYLGKCVDGDTGLLQGTASADDADKGSPEYGTCTDPANGDEDGVAIAPLHVGDTKNVVQVTANAACKLNAWVDWNHDGSWGGAGEQVFIDQVLSAGRNDLTMDVPAFAAEGTIYTRFRCSTAGGDGIGGEAADGEVEDYALNVLPAIPKTPVSVGDTIWEDTDKDGKQTAGENPLAGVTVTLLDSAGAPAKDLTGNIVAEITTDATGKYLFSNLPEGDYSVKVTPPKDYIPTQNAGDVDTVPANDDSNCAVQGDGSITTALFSLTAGGEPIDDGDTDANTNLSVDCGLYKPTEPTHSLGNKVWIDDGAGTKANANNGTLDTGEAVVADGVVVELRDAAGALLNSTTTSKGFYLFSGLAAGDYKVCVAASNFAKSATLDGFSASTGGNEVDANVGVDSTDNGSDVLTDGLCSNVITLDANAPTGEIDTASGAVGDDGIGTPDALSDLTVDFGVIPPKPVIPVSVGDTIWIDANNDGVQDKTELPLPGATVTLLNPDGTQVKDLAGNVVTYVSTDGTGHYLFSNLPEGDYTITVKAPLGYLPTTGGADADTDTSNTDSNCAVVGSSVQTPVFSLIAGSQPTTDGDKDANSNLSVDCGFYEPKTPVHSIGNRVWIDANNDGKADVGEVPAAAGVKLDLKDANGTVLASTATDAAGRYLFGGLAAGSYQVCVVADNFLSGNILEGYTASTGGNVADANTDIDGDDNGDDDISKGLCSNVVVLDDKEPTGEAGIGSTPGDDGIGTEDNRSNLTVDFGIVPPAAPKTVSVGNFVWEDTNADGKQDAAEPVLAGVEVTLLDKAGQPATDIKGNVVAPMLTDATGNYLFSNLPEGDYSITVKAPAGYEFTVQGTDATAADDSNCSVAGAINLFNLTAGAESITDGDTDANSDLTQDCGLVKPKVAPQTVSVGNFIWDDKNADGKQDATEPALAEVEVTLFDKDGQPAKDINGNVVAPAVTGADGLYGFTKLPEGDYSITVKLPKGSSYIPTKNAGDVDEVPANDDSNCAVQGDGSIASAPFTLTAGAEPGSAEDGDGANANQTVDCGFYQPTTPVHSIGNMVWVDDGAGDAAKANNGQFDDGETLPNGVKVELRDKSGAVIGSTMTAGGYYLFSGMDAGDYQVCVSASNFTGVGKLLNYTAGVNGKEADVNSDGDNNDNGDSTVADGLCSNVITLDDKEPKGELSTATGIAGDDGAGTEDNRSNLTVDFTVMPPAVPVQPKPVAVGDTIWVDANENGQQDAGEAPLAGATVTLLDKAGNPVKDLAGKDVAPITVGADGKYLFSNLPEGDYSISVVAPAGYIVTKGGADVDTDASNTDSNCAVVGSGVQTALFTLTAGGEPTDDGDTDANTNLSVDCGFYQPKAGTAIISGTVKADTTGDMVGEDALEGVTLALLNKDGTPALGKDGKPLTTLTDATGAYRFTDVAPGDYLVAETDPAGYASVIDQDGTLPEDDAANTDTNDNSIPVSVIADETDDSNDFVDRKSVATPVAVGDYIWIDTNQNGLQDAGETGLSGATVTLLDKAGQPAKDIQGNVVAPAVTGADGLYGFTKLPEGDYSITVKLPDGSSYIPTQNAGDVDNVPANNDSNCAAQSDGSIATALFTLTAGAEPGSAEDGDGANANQTVDCGFYQPKPGTAIISGTVKADTTGDTVGEDALEGVTLALLNKDGTPVLGTDGKPLTTLTDATGAYRFPDVAPGDYLVVETDPAGYTSVIDQDGTLPEDDAANTDTNDNSIPVSVIADETDDSNDFVDSKPVAKPVSVGNYVWIDANEDGIQDKSEAALAGATVTLLDAKGNSAKNLDGVVVAPITTGADGQYLFDNLPEGDYSVTVAAPAGYVVTKGGADVDTDASNTDSNCAVVGSGIQTALFTLTADGEPTDDGDTDASSNLSVDCGFYQPKAPVHSLGNRVWIDTNNNGVADVGEEPVVAGIKLDLKDASGTVLASTATDADGRYVFGNLDAGSYQVCVVADNFAAGSLLEGYGASTGGNEANANTDIDGDDNGDDDTSKGLCSGVIVLDDKEPTGEASASGTPGDDGIGTEDTLSNLTIDFGIVPPATPAKPVSVGNYVWIDANEDGIQDETEAALAGATVTLLDAKGDPAKNLDGVVVAPITTGADGQYLFDNLPEGDYSITVAAPAGYLPTKGGADVDEDASNTDSNCAVVGSGVQTALFNLTADGEPTDDGDTDANSNLSVDCGFYQPKTPVHSIGNKVWVDDGAGDAVNANNGVMDDGEQPVVDGVVMELLDKNGKVITETPTKDGYYLFTGLEAGEYSVCVAHGNFDQGLLKGYTASTGGDEKDVNAGVDNADNAENDTQDGLCSDLIVLDDKQPTGETPTASGKAGDDGMGTEDALSNLTVDFGVLPPAPVVKTVSVGDYIWIDANENGQQDKDELPLAGATVTLMDKDGKPVVLGGDAVIAPIVTGADGKYLFSGLPEGEYSISVTAPKDSGYLPTKGGAKVDTDPSNTDSNCSVDTGKTSLFSLTAGSEPDVAADGDGTDGNMTVDCGFYLPKEPTHSIGNMVWVDNGTGANANNGKFDEGETLPNGVNVELRDKDGVLISSTQTVAGFYLFDGLKAGDYQVCVAGSNFNKGAALDGYTASSVAGEADANANGDNNNNGDSTASDGLCSNVVVLNDKEPTAETPTASGTAGDDGKGTADNRSNLTVDFAVVPVEPVKPGTPVSVGNQIWVDSNANGKRDEGESLLAGAVVTLTDGSGRTVTDLDGKPVSPHTTGKDGLYVFSNLPEGDYIVTVEPPEGFFPTVGGIDADDDASDYDSNCRVNPINSTIETQPFTLNAGTEPDADGDGTNGNMTVDCGFYGSVSLGNKIWQDDNANGQQDNAEPGIAGIIVSLLEDDGITPATDISGNKVAAVTTDAIGNYLFENLKPGNYIVVVNPGKDSGYSLTKGGADPDTDTSNTDSNCKVVAGTFQTPAVTLLPGSEPGAKVDGDDESRNSTVDCGLFRPVNLGSRLWIDLDGNGKQNGGEPGVPGATVTLLTVDGKPVTDVFGDLLKPQTTDADGKYFFGNLREGAYVVKVIPPAGYLPTVAVTDPNNNDGTDSNGILNADGSIVSKPIDLKWGQEPADGGATNTTVGFGLIANLHVPTLSQWGTAIMSMLLATAAFFRRRKED